MANQNIRTPRFYIDEISYLLSRGVTQDGEFDVTATDAGDKFMGTFTTGSEPELFDMKPLNKCTFDTSADTDGHVLITIDTQSATSKKSYIAILNHNLLSSVGKIRVFAGDIATDVIALDGANAETADITWADNTLTEVVNADTTTAAADDKSVVIEPAADGTTIVTFPETSLRYWGIQFEGSGFSGEFPGTGVATIGRWGSTDLFVGGIMIGEYFDMPHAPDLSVKRSIAFDNVSVQESVGGQRYSNMASHGRQATLTTRSPFVTGSYQQNIYGGRLSFDMSFSYLASTDVMPNEYGSIQDTDDAVIEDVWNKTNGPHLPFIFSIDKDSAGDNAESEHIFARFAQNSIDMSQVALDTFNVSMKIEEEF
tara:strand:+ start:4126 stop:5232 length:1107 start_codon:yes stop_codon:yes gene_type:complete